MEITFQQAIVFLPLVTALITFFLTSLFTLFKDSKSNNFTNRIFLSYNEFELKYPLDGNPKYGEGKVLLGKNGKKLNQYTEKHNDLVFSFTILNNTTKNNAINVKIKQVISDRTGKNKLKDSNTVVTEEFFMPIWKWEETLYIPATIHEVNSNFATNEELVIRYSTPTFERFEYSYIRQDDGTYDERLKKQYLGFLWITKVKYEKSGFYSVINVRKKEPEKQKEE